MERVCDIKHLLEYNATGNHWITLTKKESGVTQSEVEYATIPGLVDTDTYFIAVYTSELEPLAYYSHPLVEDSLIEVLLNPNTIEAIVNNYKRIKEKINLYDDRYKFLLYAPVHKRWYRIEHKDLIPAINSTGFYFYLRIINSNGEIIDSTGDKDLETNQGFTESQASYGELIHAIIDGYPIGAGASSLLDLIRINHHPCNRL